MSQSISRLFSRLLHFRARIFSGKVLAVRAVCFNDEGQIFLVRHTYTPGWHLPGGGVKNGAIPEQSLRQELSEEGGLELTSAAKLLAVFLNQRASSREYVLLYKCNVRQRKKVTSLEISEGKFFDINGLPTDIDRPTLKHISETISGHFSSAIW